MKKFLLIILVACTSLIYSQIKLHPENKHYFEYKGKPTILIASGEHYGAVINKKFDFRKYLSTLKKIGLNHTRIFLGDYFENQGAFCIQTNTLAPAEGDHITPWVRSSEPGNSLGGNKFDLDKWNDEYFKRLHEFMIYAEKNEIIVEAVLFFSGYLHHLSPLSIDNNINGLDSIASIEYMTLKNSKLLTRQKDYCVKIISELNQYDNLIINVANEPWFSNQERPGFASTPPIATKEWIREVSNWIVEAESELPKKHLLSVDYTNEGQIIPEKDLNYYYKNISIFNHHYDRNAKSAEYNYGKVDRVLSFNETGLMPPITPQYRIQGWKYIFSGGALYNNLDFTYQVGAEDGSGSTEFICEGYSGCTDPKVKYQLANLLKFINSINFIKMKPNFDAVALNYGDENIYPLVWEGIEYAVYFEGGKKAKIKINVSEGTWDVKWINPSDLKIIIEERKELNSTLLELIGPEYSKDLLLFVKATK